MDPPINPPPAGPTPTPTYPDSLDSSPRSSRATDVDETSTHHPTSTKLRLMCSYGGSILPRPHDKTLCYAGGDTRIIVVERSSSLADIQTRLSKSLLNSRPFTLKYQLPNEDLDSLITLSNDEDLDNMIDEYDRIALSNHTNVSNSRTSRIRLFLFPAKPEGTVSMGDLNNVNLNILDGSHRQEDWFLSALNGSASIQRGFSDPTSVNCLLGLDDTTNGNGNGSHSNNNLTAEVVKEESGEGKMGKVVGINNQDVQSVPDSPMVETNSSFGSTSSSSPNLPPIRVHVEEQQQQRGIEEQFAQMGIFGGGGGGGGQKVPAQQVEEGGGFGVMTGVPAYSEEERSDNGLGPVGYGKTIGQQQQVMGQPVVVVGQGQQQKAMSGGGAGGELPSPDSVSR